MKALIDLCQQLKKNDSVCSILCSKLDGYRLVIEDQIDEATYYQGDEVKAVINKAFEEHDMFVYFMAAACYKAGFHDAQAGKPEILRDLEK